MPGHGHIEGIGLADVVPEVSLRECVTYMPLSSANKAAQFYGLHHNYYRPCKSKEYFETLSLCVDLSVI